MNNPDQKTAAGKDAVHIELAPPSFTMRVGKRRLTMSWRARKPVPVLLTGLLRRSWRAMFGRGLRVSMTAAAVCAAWSVSSMAAGIADNALPTGWSAAYGNASFTQTGNTLNINQTTQQAIYNFISFNIGKNATVDITQLNAAANFLARVNTGSDPSLIYGALKANGGVTLINQNGIMIGPNGTVDVARFIASTMDISNSDFLAGRMMFTTGNVTGTVENQGKIQSATGGSVYLIGANVINGGVINSPNGEILLAAGQTVQLIDTATPGVSVSVTGTAGSVTNLGTISAEAGRIGIAAGLINNSGNINASSVVSEGGRIFLRASQNLTTTASSNITANGATKGGSVVLYSDKVAYLDGGISATGAAGQGGFIETSGKESLDVVKLPTAGSGGTWLIDPYDLEVVASGGNGALSGNTVSSSSGVSSINASVISGQLNGGTSVTLTTGAGGAASGGNITVSAAINKTSGSAAGLTLNANNSIFINADITSTSGTLDLTLNSNLSGIAGDHTVNVSGALVRLNGGAINVNDGSGNSGNGNIAIKNGATIDLNQSGTLNAGTVSIATGGSLTSVYSASVNLAGDLNNSGTVGINNSAVSIGGKLLNQGVVNLANVSGTLGNITNSGTMTMASMFQGVASTALNNTGALTLSNGSTLNTGTLTNTGAGSVSVNASTLNVNALTNAVGASVTLSDSSLSATDIIHNAGTFITTNSTINTINGLTNMVSGVMTMNFLSKINNGSFNNQGLVNAYGSAGYVTFENGFTNSGLMNLKGSIMANSSATNSPGGTLNLGAAGETTTLSGSGLWGNDGTLNIVGEGNQVAISGAMMNNQTGTMLVSGSGASLSTGSFFTNTGSVTLASGGSASVTGAFSNGGSLLLNGGNLAASEFTNEASGLVSGNGSVTTGGTGFVNNGTVAPGGDGTVGALTIIGNYVQNSSGKLLIDVASASSYDTLTYTGTSIALDGILQTKWLGTSTPVLTVGFAPIVATGGSTSTGVFRHVYGDAFTIDAGLQMIKPFYNKGGQGVTLGLRGSETITFAAEGSHSWGEAGAWSTGYFPTAIDDVLVASSSTLSHNNADGIDIVKSITFNDESGLNINGGTVRVGNIISLGHSTVSVSGEGGGGGEGGGEGFNGFNNVVVTDPNPNSGVLNISGSARVSSLSLSGTGTVNGDVNSALSVTDAFSQSNGSVINSNGSVSLSQGIGDLVVGNITARNLVLESQNGAIMQTAALHVTRQLLASSVTGLTLDNGANRIAAFAANNRGINDIILRNNLDVTDTSVFRINGVTNANGSISIINTGATATTTLGSGADFLTTLPTVPDLDPVPSLTDRLTTLGIVSNGTVSAGMLSHTVTIEAHSPLTIGSGGITAAGGIALSAGTAGSGSSNDSLVINGLLASAGGTINLVAGGSLNINANITGAYTPGVPAPVYGPGVTLNGVLVGPPIQTTPNPTTSTTTTPITVATETTSQIDRSVNNTQTTTTSTPSTSGTNPVIDNTQTTGGGAGNFGGDDSEPAGGQSKPAGDGKKAVKLYCS